MFLNSRSTRALSRTLITVLFIGLGAIANTAPSNAAVMLYINDTDASLSFVKANSTQLVGGSSGGINANDVILYKAVGTYGGVTVDAVVTTVAISSGSISNYDNPGSATSVTGSSSYWMINTLGGNARFRFEFFKGGSYSGAGSGIPVILQNLKVTSIDIDTSGTGANQYSDFTGFQKYSMMSPTNLAVVAQPAVSGQPNRVRFIANLAGSRSSVPQDQVLVKYDAVQKMEIDFGNIKAGSTNYFGLIFGGWPGSGVPVEYPNQFNSPPISTNTTIGVSDSLTAPSIIPVSAFGDYQDLDQNPFYQIKIATLPASGTLEKFNGSAWVSVSANDIFLITDLDANKLRYVANATPADSSFKFSVHDGLEFSASNYTLSLVVKAATQVITFNNPGVKAPGTTFPSGATTTATGETVTLTSQTPGVCSVNPATGAITAIKAGTCVITATQPGNSTYPAATPVEQTFLITAATPQVITFNNPGTKTESTVAFSSLATTNASGLFVTLTSSDITICTVNNPGGSVPTIVPKKAGTCTVTATQAGNGTYDPAVSVTVSFLISAPGSSGGGGGGSTSTGPEVHTAGAESISTSGATLYGLMTPSGTSMTYKFCWTRSSSAISNSRITAASGSNNQVKCSSSNTNVPSAGPNVSVNEVITKYIKDGNEKNLESDKTYYFQVIGIVGSQSYYGEIMSFKIAKSGSSYVRAKTTAVDPSADITETSAILKGAFNSSKTTTQATYCVTTDPTQTLINTKSLNFQNIGLANCKELTSSRIVASSLPVAGTESSTVLTLTGLKGDTWYYFQTRTYETSNKLTGFGRIVAFKTSSAAPVATTLPVTMYESVTAILPGSVISNGDTSTVTFCYGTASNLAGCQSVNATPANALGTSAVSVSAQTAALTVGTRYYYRVVATRTSDSVVSNGEIKTFVLGAPAVSTLSVSSLETDTVSTWKADLNGYLKPMGFLATPSFCWGTSNTVDSNGILQGSCASLAVSSIDSTTANTGFAQTLTGLSADTTYYYQAKALNREALGSLTSYGEVLSFTTVLPPSAVTDDPTNIGAKSAQLNGNITSLGDSATVTFCLSLSNTRTPDDNEILLNCDFPLNIDQNASSKLLGTSVAASKSVSDLTINTTYYYQITAANKKGSAVGSVKSFITTAGGPLINTLPNEFLTNTSTKIYGNTNANGSNTSSYFCVNTSNAFSVTDGGDSMTACSTYRSPSALTVASTTIGSVSQIATISGLTTTTTYYYQLIGTNARGETVYGKILSFALNLPIVTTNSTAESVTATSARIRGTANKNSSAEPIHASFCISDVSELAPSGVLSDCDPTDLTFTSIGNSTVNISQIVTGLNPGTEYFYQAYVAATADTTTPTSGGLVYSFITDALVTFDPNGGTGLIETQTAASSVALRFFSGLNYALGSDTFIKWNTRADGSGTDYSDGATYSFDENLTLYVIWSGSVTTFSVTYDLGGGNGSIPVEGNKTTGQTFAAASGAGITKSGFTFAGWSCNGTTFAAGATVTMGSSNFTCVAQWSANVLTPNVTKQKLKLTWPNPSSINFGIPLGGGQLNAATDAPSRCTYSPAAGTLLAVGTYTLSVTCVPTDATAYEAVTGTVTLVVKKGKGKPRIIWFNPSSIVNPTPLSGTQLNAVANVPGRYSYSPAAGTVLVPGRHPLNVKFTPSDEEENESIEANVTIDVTAPKNQGSNQPKPSDTATATTPQVAPTKPVSTPDTKTVTTPALAPAFKTDGKAEVVTVKQNEEKTGIIVSSDDWSLQIKSTTQFVQGTVEDTSARVVIEKGNTVTTSGTGFKSNSQVDVYVYSTPTWLGAVITDEFGNFTTTLPMPDALPAGDHTFQAQGLTPDDRPRAAAIPITLVPATVKGKPGFMRFEVYFGMNSPVVSKSEKAKIGRMVKLVNSKKASTATLAIEVSGWVQPNPNPGNIKFLSTNRAKNVAAVLKALGVKGKYTLKFPGLEKDNIPTARHATVIIKWSLSK